MKIYDYRCVLTEKAPNEWISFIKIIPMYIWDVNLSYFNNSFLYKDIDIQANYGSGNIVITGLKYVYSVDLETLQELLVYCKKECTMVAYSQEIDQLIFEELR